MDARSFLMEPVSLFGVGIMETLSEETPPARIRFFPREIARQVLVMELCEGRMLAALAPARVLCCVLRVVGKARAALSLFSRRSVRSNASPSLQYTSRSTRVVSQAGRLHERRVATSTEQLLRAVAYLHARDPSPGFGHFPPPPFSSFLTTKPARRGGWCIAI